MTDKRLHDIVRREWRDLGYYYDSDESSRMWRVLGSRNGLAKFASHIRDYAETPSSKQISEHIHLGPYMYLKIGTWEISEITEHWIAGPIHMLKQLAQDIERIASEAQLGSIHNLRAQFAPESPYELRIEMQSDDFDPANADSLLY